MLPQLEPTSQRLSENLKLFDETLAPLSPAEIQRAPREGEYSGRAVIAHLAGANRGMTRLMQQMVAGQQPRLKADYNNDYYNARQQEKRAGLSVEQLRAELDETHRDLLAFMESLRAEDLIKRGEHPTVGDSTVLQVLETLAAHEQSHIEEFGAWAQEMAATRS
jgi:hypothetical protein